MHRKFKNTALQGSAMHPVVFCLPVKPEGLKANLGSHTTVDQALRCASC